MNDLLKAYAVLQLSPGTSMVLINQRYKRLVMSWHPDKFRGEQAKATAERELKNINNARDILRDHFRNGGHRESGNCDCRPAPEKAPQTETGSEQSARSHNQQANSASSSFQSANAGSGTNDNYKSSSCNDTSDRSGQAFASGNPFHNAFRRRHRESDGLRWRVSLLCAFTFLLLLVTTVVSDVFAVTNAFVRNGFKVGQTNHEPRVEKASDFEGAVSQLKQNNRCADAQWYHGNFAVRPPHDSGVTAQDLRTTKEDIERYEQAIKFSHKKLTELALILADPNISMRDRQFAVSGQATQLKFLQESQNNLKYAHQRLDELQGTGAAIVSAPPQVVPASPGQAVKSLLESLNMDPVIGPGGSINARDGRFLHLSNGH